MATAHLVHGYLCAGKTTFARQLEASTGALRLSADEWYLKLHVPEGTTSHVDRAAWDRLLSTLDDLWPTLLGMGVDVILDFGFWSRVGRDRARRLATAAGATARLYELRCREDLARARCHSRNNHPDGSFVIDLSAYEALKVYFEPLTDDEDRRVIDTGGGLQF